MLLLIRLIIELRETVKYRRVGKLLNLFRLITPQFASISKFLYTRELLTQSLLKKAYTADTFIALLNALLLPTKGGKTYVVANTIIEQLIYIIKETFVERGAYNISNIIKNTTQIISILYLYKQAIINLHLLPNYIKQRGKYYNPLI